MTLREVHNTMGAPKTGAGTKPEAGSAAASTPRSRPAFKVPKLLKSNNATIGGENKPPLTAKSSTGASCTDTGAAKASGAASRRRVTSAPATRDSKATTTTGAAARKAPAGVARATGKTAVGAAKKTSVIVASVPTPTTKATPRALPQTPVQEKEHREAEPTPQGRRRRAPPPQRYGQWVTGTPALEADTPACRDEAPSPLPLPPPVRDESPVATKEAAGRHNSHWQPGLHSGEAARVAAMTQQAMAALLEAVPEEEEEVVGRRKGAGRHASLQERLQQSWEGQSYYSRLKAMAGPAIEEGEEEGGEEEEEKVENVTDLLLKMNLTHAHNSRKSISASSVMSAVRAASVSPPNGSVRKAGPVAGGSGKPSAAATAHVRGKSASRTSKAAAKKDAVAAASTESAATKTSTTTAVVRKGGVAGNAKTGVSKPTRAKNSAVVKLADNSDDGKGSNDVGGDVDEGTVTSGGCADDGEVVASETEALRAALAASEAALGAERARVKELTAELERVGAEMAVLRAEGAREREERGEGAAGVREAAAEVERRVAELKGLTEGLSQMAGRLC